MSFLQDNRLCPDPPAEEARFAPADERSQRSMTLMPRRKSSVFAERSLNNGGWAWIGRRSGGADGAAAIDRIAEPG